MQPRLKSRIILGGAALALLAGAGGTYAATQGGGSGEREAFLKDAAERLDVTPQKLEDALSGAFSERLDAAVRSGRLTREQADEIKRRVREHGGPPFIGGPPHFGAHGPHGAINAGIEAAAKYLGVSKQEVREQLGSDKSPADVARARGKSVEGLKQAIRDGVEQRLEKDVDAKRITEGEKRRFLEGLDRRIGEIVERSGPPGPRGGPGGKPGGFDGPPGGGPGGPGFGGSGSPGFGPPAGI